MIFQAEKFLSDELNIEKFIGLQRLVSSTIRLICLHIGHLQFPKAAFSIL